METIEISNHPFGPKRKVEWDITLINEREQVIKLFTICKHYENVNGEYGDEINTLSFKSFERILTAKKGGGKFVDIDGMSLYSVVDNTDPENPVTNFFRVNNQQPPTQVIDQYDFFINIFKNQSINIPTLGRSVIQTEDLVHKTYDK